MKTISQSLFILTLLACAILVAMEMLPNVTNQSNAFDSPLPTPVIPDPTPTPDLPKETQQALEYIVGRDKISVEQLAVMNQHRREYALLGQSFWSVTVLDIKSGQWYQVMVNLDDGSIVQDVEIIEQAEQEARRVKYGKLEPALFERLEAAREDDLIEVAIWIAGDLKRSREDLYAELAEKYPESRKALEQSGNPFDVSDYKLINEIESEYVRLIEADVQERLSPLVRYLQDRGYVVTTLGALPSIAVTLPRKAILDLVQRNEVGMIYLNEGKVQRLMDSAAPSDRAPAVWQRGYRGNGVSIGILESGKVDFDGPVMGHNWLHQGTVRSCSGGVDWHKTLVTSIAASYHPTYTGIAPDATIVDICTDDSRADTVAGLAWGVGYADVINASLTFNNDPTLEWTDRAFDYWARTGNDTVVAGAGNVQDGYVGSPAKGWNVIAVGGSNDNNTSGWGDDGMFSSSSWHDPTGGDREKPEVVAPAVSIFGIELDNNLIDPDRSNGTSWAAPQVTGLAALLIDRNAELAANPPAVTAIIMASAVNNVDGPSGIPVGDDLKDGAGAIDAALADMTAKTRCASTTPSSPDPCWWSTTITSASFAQGYLYRTFRASKGEEIRVAISWWSNADCASQNTCNYDRLDTDLNLAIKYLDPNDQQWKILSSCGSGSQDNNYELVEFVAPYTTQYAVAVYKQRMNESSNMLGIAWVKQGVYLPDIKSGYNGWESWITIRNDGARPKDVGIVVFNANGVSVSGGLWYPGLPPGASYTFDSWVTDFFGSAIVNASEDVSVVVNNVNTSSGHAYSYNGIAAADPLNSGWGQVGTDIHLPLLMNASNGWSSSVTIFNTGGEWATISLDYDGQGGPYAGPQNVSLGPNASVTYDQSGSACPLVGAGRVRSSNGQPLAVMVRQVHSGGMTMAYNGFSSGAATVSLPSIRIGAEGSTSPAPPPAGPYRIYMPLAMAGNRGWNAALAVQNLGAAQTDITVSYYPSSGYGALASQTAYNVQPHTTAIFAPSAAGLWIGAARITNSAGQPVAAVVNETSSSQVMSYNGFLNGSSLIVLPYLRSDGGWTTSVQVQNLEASAAAVVVKVNGTPVWSGTIGAYSSVTIPLSAGSGSATVECTNGKRVAAIVTATGVGPGDRSGDYNGINR